MRTSAITNNKRVRGFSLLEIMVVVGLIALMAALAVPTIVGDRGPGELDKQRERLTGMLEHLNEQSLFLGQMLAARLEPDRIQPLRYAYEEGGFVPMKGDNGPGALALPDGIRLEWRLEEADRQQGPRLREAVSARLGDQESGDRGGSVQGSGEDAGSNSSPDSADKPDDAGGDSAGDTPPQLFFFPSGEVTPITLWLRPADASHGAVELEVNSLGRVQQADAGDARAAR